MKIALVAMPWPLFNRPSVQLGALKGYLRRKWPELEVRNLHPYLRVAEALGYELYHRLDETSWLAESFGAALLFPEKRPEIEDLVKKVAHTKGFRVDFSRVLAGFRESLEDYFSAIDWSGFSAVGFSVCLNQLTASLWGAKWLKERFPHLPVIFGGSGCAEEMGRSLLELFPQVDFVVNGEGEIPLHELLRHLLEGAPFPAQGVFFRENGKVKGGGRRQLPAEELPSPVYEDYLKEVASLPPERRFFPLIPLEASRGCWWFKCRFCNLNLQWEGFRKKPLSQVLTEIRAHARAGLLDFAFMDNCLPVKDSLALFAALAEDGVDYRFFAELRAVYRREEYHLLRRGGLTWVQIGIEALSTSLLKRLNKGTRAIDNVAAMRHCEEAGLELEGNLIFEFPGSTAEEVEETLRHLDFVFPFRPLHTVSFWLGYGSPVFRAPKAYGLKAIYRHPYYRRLFPEEVARRLVPLVWAYRGDRERQRRLWQPVREKVARWQEAHRRLRAEKGPLLSFRDGKNFILIRQVLSDGRVLHHRLTGPSREIYLYLRDVRSFEEIRKRYSMPEEALRRFLNDLVEKRLLFHEADHYLALAIKERR